MMSVCTISVSDDMTSTAPRVIHATGRCVAAAMAPVAPDAASSATTADLSARIAPSVRVTGVLIEHNALLLEHMVLRERSHWTLPGGHLQYGETIDQCLRREMREETGLDVAVDDMLYVCDRFHGLGSHVVDMSFLIHRVNDSRIACPLPLTDDPITEVAMVPFERLTDYGFSAHFARLVRDGFPNRGSYGGEFHAFYG